MNRKRYITQRYDQDIANSPEVVKKIKFLIEKVIAKDSDYLSNSLSRSLQHAVSI